MKDSSDYLREAAEYIAEHGHHKGSYEHWSAGAEHPVTCALGALRRVTGDRGMMGGRFYEAAALLGSHLEREGLIPRYEGVVPLSHIPIWNDAPERTAEDVILAMKRAAEDE
ncbi:hypothetical protein [Streptomyces sp. NPDC015131]|uniref:DUF6197 family protein n=1 Tax=Streptomyces sp. NPDC015131 TaxID=3364941 RepID=UPI0036FE66A5